MVMKVYYRLYSSYIIMYGFIQIIKFHFIIVHIYSMKNKELFYIKYTTQNDANNLCKNALL